MTSNKSTLKGFEGLEASLRELGPEVGNTVVQSAVTSAARVGAKEVKAATPEHTGPVSPSSAKYGTAKQNVKVKRLKRVPPGTRGARIDTGNAFWTVFFDRGTRHQPARPYFANAFQRASDAMLSVLGKKLGQGIEKAAIKMKGKNK